MTKTRYEVLRYYPVTSPDELIGLNNKTLLEWWLSFAPNIPFKSDFDILDHIDLVSDIFLVKRLSDTDYEFRVHGESAHNIFDDNIGKTISTNGPETTEKEREDVRLARYYTEFLKQSHCFRNEGNLPFLKKEHIRFESLDCPLLDEDKNPIYIIGTIAILNDKNH